MRNRSAKGKRKEAVGRKTDELTTSEERKQA